MSQPLRFHPTLKKDPHNYSLFCCDRDHADYVKRYFSDTVPHVDFISHVGAVPGENVAIVPYEKRKYDILFSATYHSPQSKLEEMPQVFAESKDIRLFYRLMYDNLAEDSSLTTGNAVFLTLKQTGWTVSDDILNTIFRCAEYVDRGIRMYQRERVADVSTWVDEHFTDGVDIALYDLKHLEDLPEIAGKLLNHPAEAEK